MVDVKGGVTAPLGFTSAAVHCGIKPKAGALDLTVIAADRPASAAGLFTTNLAKAAPVLVSREHLERSGGWRAPSWSTAAAPTRARAKPGSETRD